MTNEIGERVRALRKAVGLTQEQVAIAAGLERVEVVQIETGKNKATSARMQKGLAKSFHLSVDEIGRVLSGALDTEPAAALYRKRARAASPTRAAS